mmetsp:Transcript_63852/g.118703  ORF Transcript_63852/g.118703 Transcript_63852/m.118703 type:complete len:192 (+) Transcript_63852:40-615(+)
MVEQPELAREGQNVATADSTLSFATGTLQQQHPLVASSESESAAAGASLEDVVRVTSTLVPLFLDVRDIVCSFWAASQQVHEHLSVPLVWADLCLRHWPALHSEPNRTLTKQLFRDRYSQVLREERTRAQWKAAVPPLRLGRLSFAACERSAAAPPTIMPGCRRLSAGAMLNSDYLVHSYVRSGGDAILAT